jgi:hypothetical protein
MYSKVVTFVPHLIVKDILSHQECLGVKGNWVSMIYKYDLEIKPTMLVKGQGPTKMLTKGNEEARNLGCETGPKMTLAVLEYL